MMKPSFTLAIIVFSCGLLLQSGARAASATHLQAEVYAPPTQQELDAKVQRWLAARKVSPALVKDAVAPLWQFEERPSTEQLFNALIRTFYFVDDDVRTLVERCRAWSYSQDLASLQWTGKSREATEPLLVNNVRFFLGRHFALLSAYNEALELFKQIDIKQVVDPAGCLFYRAVCEHHLLMKKEGLATLDALLNQTQDVPVRYRKLAELMQSDLRSVEEKSLGEVARQMKDVERRLSLNKSDQGVQDVEDRIIATLDDLIKKMEEQQQQQSGAQSGSFGQQGSNPAQDSYQGGMRGPGLTDKRDVGHQDRWGDLPPKAREAAQNMLDRQFPAHYRQAVEEYLKKLAERPAPDR